MASDRIVAAALALCVALAGAQLHAAPPAGGAPSAKALGEAQDLFQQGLALLRAGDLEGALDCFLRSRALVPGKGNTANAAHCLHELGRYDEAFELYEELVARWAAELSDDNRARLVPAMAALRARLGSIALTANVDGTVLVDGRPRGRLPLARPLRVVAGPHVLRVLKDGYGTFERAVSVAAGGSVSLDAALRPLAEAGQLRLEDPANQGADVFVDRVRVGVVPWEGTLGPGEHLVWDTAAERGSAPVRAIVVQGQTATLVLRSAPLGPVATIAVEPHSAEVRLDGVSLGTGPWSARMPVGPHQVDVSEPGFVTHTVRFAEPAPGAPPPRITVKLDVDPAHPRWPRGLPGAFFVDVFGGFGGGKAMGSGAEAWCPARCTGGPRLLGGLVGGRAGFRFAFGLSLEIAAGYASFGESLARSISTAFQAGGRPHWVTWSLADQLALHGPFVGGAVGWRVPFHGRFALVSRVTAAVLIGGATDPITGTASTASGSAPVIVTGRGERLDSTPMLLEPELDVEARLGSFRVGLGLGIAAIVGSGPAFGHDLVEVSPAGCSRTSPGAAACAPAQSFVAGERAYHAFATAVPALSLGYVF